MFGPPFGLSEFTASTGEVIRADPYYLKSLSVTFTYVFVSVPLKLIFALAVAMLLNQKLRAVLVLPRRVLHPHTARRLGGDRRAVAEAVRETAVGERNPGGPRLHQPPRGWITNPDYALGTLVLLTVWQFGSSMVIPRRAEADSAGVLRGAAVDGANKVRQFLTITIPLLSPVILFTLTLQMTSRVPGVHPGYIIGGGSGGVLNSTLFYTLHLYIQRWTYHEMGTPPPWRGCCCSLSGCSRRLSSNHRALGVIRHGE